MFACEPRKNWNIILAMTKKKPHSIQAPPTPIIGWREWVHFPDLANIMIKAKVDTGARSSSLHAFNLVTFERDGQEWVRFAIHPLQDSREGSIDVESRVMEHRSVRSSNGKSTIRPVISANITLLDITWPIEITLANRDEMGFRMLLGREAFRKRFLVDAGSSFYGGKPKRVKKVENRSPN